MCKKTGRQDLGSKPRAPATTGSVESSQKHATRLRGAYGPGPDTPAPPRDEVVRGRGPQGLQQGGHVAKVKAGGARLRPLLQGYRYALIADPCAAW